MWCRMVLIYLLGKPRVVGSIPGRDTHSLWSCLRDGIQGKTLANETLAMATLQAREKPEVSLADGYECLKNLFLGLIL